MGNGSSSLLFMVKVIVLWLVSDSHEVMTAFVVVEISLQVSGYIFFAMSAFLSEIALPPVQMTFFEWLAMVFLFVQG